MREARESIRGSDTTVIYVILQTCECHFTLRTLSVTLSNPNFYFVWFRKISFCFIERVPEII